jgi:phosphatidylethanolamine-binding protein (PEBP) family uncharacterized protein
MRLTRRVCPAAPLVATVFALALAACGGTSARTTSATARTSTGSTATSVTASTAKTGPEHSKDSPANDAERVPLIDIHLKSSVPLSPISNRYTCHGANLAPALSWSGTPRGTKELALFVVSELPIHGKLDFAWAVTGLSPQSTGVSSGKLPAGAVVGRNSAGTTRYSLCPPANNSNPYVIILYALPRKVSVKQGFDPEPLVEGKLRHIARHEGEMFVTYEG